MMYGFGLSSLGGPVSPINGKRISVCTDFSGEGHKKEHSALQGEVAYLLSRTRIDDEKGDLVDSTRTPRVYVSDCGLEGHTKRARKVDRTGPSSVLLRQICNKTTARSNTWSPAYPELESSRSTGRLVTREGSRKPNPSLQQPTKLLGLQQRLRDMQEVHFHVHRPPVRS